jgi:hypothetical protein
VKNRYSSEVGIRAGFTVNDVISILNNIPHKTYMDEEKQGLLINEFLL